MSMIESKLSFFEMIIKCTFRHAVKLSQTTFGIAPEGLNPVDMMLAAGKLIGAMIDAKVLVKADVNQAIVAPPSVGVDDRFRPHAPPDNGLQGGLSALRDDLRIDFAVALKAPKTMVLPNAPRPRFPRTRWAPK
jgi:hypothetical protein